MKKIILISTLLCLINFISADPGSSEFKWLLGKWVSETEKTVITETWRWVSENTIEGTSVTKNKSDGKVTGTESIRLLKMEGEIFYLAKIKHNKLPIAFKMTQLSDSSSTFENPEHDFPTKIIYKLTSPCKLEVIIENRKKSGKFMFFKKSDKAHFTIN